MLISTLNQVQQKQSYPRFLVFISFLLFVCDTQASTSDFFTFNEATKLNSNFKELTSAFKYPHWSNPDNKLIGVSYISLFCYNMPSMSGTPDNKWDLWDRFSRFCDSF